MAEYKSESVQRVLKLIAALAGHEAHGVRPSDLTAGLGESPSQITKALANLELAGWAEIHPAFKGKNENRWRLTVQFIQLANTVASNLMQAQRQLSQDVHNYSLMR